MWSLPIHHYVQNIARVALPLEGGAHVFARRAVTFDVTSNKSARAEWKYLRGKNANACNLYASLLFTLLARLET